MLSNPSTFTSVIKRVVFISLAYMYSILELASVIVISFSIVVHSSDLSCPLRLVIVAERKLVRVVALGSCPFIVAALYATLYVPAASFPTLIYMYDGSVYLTNFTHLPSVVSVITVLLLVFVPHRKLSSPKFPLNLGLST